MKQERKGKIFIPLNCEVLGLKPLASIWGHPIPPHNYFCM